MPRHGPIVGQVFGKPVSGTNLLLDAKFIQGVMGCLTLLALGQLNGFNESGIAFLNQNRPSIDWRTWKPMLRMEPRLRTTGHLTVAKGREGELHIFVRNGDARGGLFTAFSSK